MAIMWINKQTKTKTSKTINPKKQNIWDNVWCRLMFLFSLGFFCFVLVSKWKFEKNVFVEWIWSIKISKETQGLSLVLETFQCRKPNLKCWKTKNNLNFVCFFDTSWLIISIQKNKFFWLNHFNTKKIKKEKTIFWVKTKHSLKRFFGFARVFVLSLPGFVCFSRCGPKQVWL